MDTSTTITKLRKLLNFGFILIVCLSITAAAYKYIYLQDFTSIFFVPCDQSNAACFIDYENCNETNPIDCAYSAVVVKTSLLSCPSDDGECVSEYCAANSEQCYYVTGNDDLDAFGIYGELLE